MDIKIKTLVKRFDGETILRGIDLDFPFGNKIALVGANGSGKSTLLRAMMGMIAYEGEIGFFSEDKKQDPLSVKRRVAYVPQISPYFSSLVSDVVNTFLGLRGIPFDDLKIYLEALNLSYDMIGKLPFKKLSGGMKQKLMIALAFSSRPQVLFFDEPTASLDPDSRKSFYDLCQGLPTVSLLLCSHRLEEINHLVDTVLVLDRGSIAFRGTTQEYLNKVL